MGGGEGSYLDGAPSAQPPHSAAEAGWGWGGGLALHSPLQLSPLRSGSVTEVLGLHGLPRGPPPQPPSKNGEWVGEGKQFQGLILEVRIPRPPQVWGGRGDTCEVLPGVLGGGEEGQRGPSTLAAPQPTPNPLPRPNPGRCLTAPDPSLHPHSTLSPQEVIKM